MTGHSRQFCSTLLKLGVVSPLSDNFETFASQIAELFVIKNFWSEDITSRLILVKQYLKKCTYLYVSIDDLLNNYFNIFFSHIILTDHSFSSFYSSHFLSPQIHSLFLSLQKRTGLQETTTKCNKSVYTKTREKFSYQGLTRQPNRTKRVSRTGKKS